MRFTTEKSSDHQTLLLVQMRVVQTLQSGLLIRGFQLVTPHPWSEDPSLVDLTR